MGILQDNGILDSDKKLTDKAWTRFVIDVNLKMSTGFGALPVALDAFVATLPIPGAQLLKLQDKYLFPEFETKWRQRYEDMAKSMDVDGAYGFFQKSGLPVTDPTAIAVSMGSPPPPMQFAEALQSVIDPSKQPKIPLDLLTSIGDPSLTEVPPNPELSEEEKKEEKQKKEDQSLGKLIEVLTAQVPLPPIPVPPDTKLLELGYSEEYSQALDDSLAPVLTYADVQIPTNVLELPKALGNIPLGILNLYATPAAKYAPKTIEGCNFDAIVNQTIQEHKAKFGALAFVGQNVGSGVLTSALAATPFDQGGLGITNEVEEKPEIPKLIGGLSNRRTKIKTIIKSYLGDPPDGIVSWNKDKKKFEELTTWTPPGWFVKAEAEKKSHEAVTKALKKDGKIGATSGGTGDWYGTNGTDIMLYPNVPGNTGAGSSWTMIVKKGPSTYTAYNITQVGSDPPKAYEPTVTGDNVTQISVTKAMEANMDKFIEQKNKELTGKLMEDYHRDQKGKSPTLTTCGAFPSYVLRKLGIDSRKGEGMAKGLMDPEPTPPHGGVDGKGARHVPSIQGGGLEAVRQAARYLKCWVEAVDKDGNWTGKFPVDGDIIIWVDPASKPQSPETKGSGGEFTWNLPQDNTPRHIGVLYDKYGLYKGKDQGYTPVYADPEMTEAGEEEWLTADAGQGAAFEGKQHAGYTKRKVLIPQKDKNTGGWIGPLKMIGETLEKNGDRKLIPISGWVDVDKIEISKELL